MIFSDLLCSVVHVFPPRFVGKNKRNLQEFVVVNDERRPLILTLWEEFLQTEAPYLAQNVHNMPIILGMRLSVNTFYGLSIGTVPNSTIMFEPPIQEAKQLHLWMENNKEYVESVVSQKLYEKSNQPINQPLGFQIRKIGQILSLTEMVKSFWIRARLQIIESDNSLYFLACPDCCRPCGAEYKYEFTCFYCHHDFPSPKPMLRFQADLCDGTGSLRVYIEHNEAKNLLGMSGEEIIEAEDQKKQPKLDDINDKFKDIQFLFQVRTSKNEVRGKLFIRNTIITCLPSTEAPSTSHSSVEKSSSLPIQKHQHTDVTMVESQESTSQIEERCLPADPAEQHSSAGKKRLPPKEKLAKEASKHAKQE